MVFGGSERGGTAIALLLVALVLLAGCNGNRGAETCTGLKSMDADGGGSEMVEDACIICSDLLSVSGQETTCFEGKVVGTSVQGDKTKHYPQLYGRLDNWLDCDIIGSDGLRLACACCLVSSPTNRFETGECYSVADRGFQRVEERTYIANGRCLLGSAPAGTAPVDTTADISMGKLISRKALRTHSEHKLALDEQHGFGVSTHYGDDSEYAELLTTRFGGSHPKALLYALLKQGDLSTLNFDLYGQLVLQPKSRDRVMEQFEQRIAQEVEQAVPRLPTTDGVYRYYKLRMEGKDAAEALSLATSSTASDVDRIPRESSCIGIVLDVLKEAHNEAGLGSRYQQLFSAYTRTGKRGIGIARELVQQGWQVIFVAPDSQHPHWNKKNEHGYAIQVAQGQHTYYDLPIDLFLLDFRPSTTTVTDAGETTIEIHDRTRKDSTVIDLLHDDTRVNGGYVLARGGDHIALLVRDKSTDWLSVFENHQDKDPIDEDLFEVTILDTWDWGSYVVLVPPGTLDPARYELTGR